MLTAVDRYRILADFRLVCNVNWLPTDVNPESWDVRPERDQKWKLGLCKASFALFILHAMYKMFRLLNIVLFSASGIPLHQIIIHSILVADGVLFTAWHYWLHYKHADVHAAFVRITLTGRITGGLGPQRAIVEIC